MDTYATSEEMGIVESFRIAYPKLRKCQYLGMGCTRIVFLSPSGKYVYKFSLDDNGVGYQDNMREAKESGKDDDYVEALITGFLWPLYLLFALFSSFIRSR